jgi:hypothetical protein
VSVLREGKEVHIPYPSVIFSTMLPFIDNDEKGLVDMIEVFKALVLTLILGGVIIATLVITALAKKL